MKTVTKTLFTYAELDERAKERAAGVIFQRMADSFEPEFTTEFLHEWAQNVYGIDVDTIRTGSHPNARRRPELYWSTYPTECAYSGEISLELLRKGEAEGSGADELKPMRTELIRAIEWLNSTDGIDAWGFRAKAGGRNGFNLTTDCEIELNWDAIEEMTESDRADLERRRDEIAELADEYLSAVAYELGEMAEADYDYRTSGKEEFDHYAEELGEVFDEYGRLCAC
jgi:hypothetical protein